MEIVYEMAEIGGPKHAKFVSLKLHFLKIPMDSVQYNTGHYGMHDDTDDEHSVIGVTKTARWSVLFKDVFELNEYVRIDYYSCDSVIAQCHTFHRNFQKVQL